jgi:hypothetical protein
MWFSCETASLLAPHRQSCQSKGKLYGKLFCLTKDNQVLQQSSRRANKSWYSIFSNSQRHAKYRYSVLSLTSTTKEADGQASTPGGWSGWSRTFHELQASHRATRSPLALAMIENHHHHPESPYRLVLAAYLPAGRRTRICRTPHQLVIPVPSRL